ncbi:beta-hexosaminidase subunit alpha [Folsomia candida]|uniref:Beta-hexosaminidase n=1 Tax=Folsomia candida TaxID=158441 RepID=A0A226DG05_FOLCA|nr:beta-hexosaminidase subunit alpha [Folsomia candida]OXA43918.1 Beta-hexosaminidase subunit beta [Folsomia candida]
MLLRFLFLASLVHTVFGHLSPIAARLPLVGTPSPPGSPWPRPESLVNDTKFATISGRDFTFYSNVECPLLSTAFARYDAKFLFRNVEVTPSSSTPLLSRVLVNIPENAAQNLCNDYPKLYTEEDRNYERYTIDISLVSDNQVSAVITGWTVWGALYGMETFSQLIWKDETASHFYVNLTQISDAPRFPHRGLMLDTARHYVDLPIIQTVLDGMAMNKLNVFHWHLVDDQSFPFVSGRYPDLAKKGAYPGLTYEPEEVQAIMDYARDRGIRVILEFDTPGHTLGFGKTFPNILTPCYDENGENPGTAIPGKHAAYEILDPTNEDTFEVMREFFTEIRNVTRDEYVHLGMDEVYPACWNSSPVVRKFMKEQVPPMLKIHDLEEYYVTRHLEMIKQLGLKSIIWHDPIDYGVDVSKDVIIQVWKGGDAATPDSWVPYWRKALELNYTSILSSCWYLNYISYGGASSSEFRKYYECDPIKKLPRITEEQRKLVLGGEAACWGEYVDSTNLLTRIFPLVGTMAERLWSKEFEIDTKITDDAWHRLDQHRCRMLWRGITAQPLFNGYCFPEEKTGLRKPQVDNSGAMGNNMGIVTFFGTMWLLFCTRFANN